MTLPASTAKNKLFPPTDWFIWGLVVLLVFIMAARTPLDSDLFWHLRAGEDTLKNGQPVLSDAYSYTRLGMSWVNHSWLAEVGLALLFRAGGWLAISAVIALFAALMMGLTYFQMSGPPLFRAFLIVLGCVVAAPVWSPRPQTATLLLLALESLVLWGYKWRQVDRLWILPLLFVLWSNLHGGYIIGVGLLGVVMGGEVLNHLLRRQGDEIISWRRLGRLGLWSLAALIALGINPNGIQTYLIPFQTVKVQALQQYIQEWASPDFHNLIQQPLLVLMVLLLAAVGFSGRKMDAADFLTVSAFGVLALLAQRNLGPFALVALPVLARYGWCAVLSWRRDRRATGQSCGEMPYPADPVVRDRPRWQHWVNLVLILLAVAVAVVKVAAVTQTDSMLGNEKEIFPAGAVAVLQAEQPQGNLLNEYNWGGYLLWKLPEYPVFVDGRTDLFGDEIIGQWITLMNAGEGWQGLIERYAIHSALIQPDRPLVNALQAAGWETRYQDDLSILLVAP